MRTLGIVPYYGGKHKMASIIADVLDYSDSSIYVEGFAGGARVLLNKAKHEKEFCYETNPGMHALLNVLSDGDSAMELMNRLHSDTQPTEEYFLRCLLYRKRHEESFAEELLNRMFEMLDAIDADSNNEFRVRKEFYALLFKQLTNITEGKEISRIEMDRATKHLESRKLSYVRFDEEVGFTKKDFEVILSSINVCIEAISHPDNAPDMDFSDSDLEVYKNEFYRQYEEQRAEEKIPSSLSQSRKVNIINKLLTTRYMKLFCSLVDEMLSESGYVSKDGYNEMELAVATYVVQVLSRNGMGQDFAKGFGADGKFVGYYKRINELYEVMHRMEGVKVYDDSIVRVIRDINLLKEESRGHALMNRSAMFYLDPPYLQQTPDEDAKIYNPSALYQSSWNRLDHEAFLGMICDAEFKIAISNYDDSFGLYDSFLTSERGWSKLEIPIKTNVAGGKSAADRVECLWVNY